MFRIAFIISLFLLFSCTVVFTQSTEEQLAIQYYQEGSFEKAADIFEKLYQERPNAYYYNYYINSLVGANDYTTAERFIRRLMRQQRDNVRLNVDLGYIYKTVGETKKAEREYENVLKNLEANERTIREAASAFLARRELELAVQVYIKGRGLMKNNTLFGFELGNLYEVLHKFDEMVNEYLDLLEVNTSTYLTHVQNRLQNSLANDPEGKKGDALRNELLVRIQKNPSSTFYSEMLLWYAVQLKDFETAFIQARALDRRLRQNGEQVFNLGNLALSNEDFDVAVKSYEYIIEIGEKSPFYIDSRVKLLHTRYSQIIQSYEFTENDLLAIEAGYVALIEEFGMTFRTLTLIKDLAYIRAFHLHKTDDAIALLSEAVNIRNVQAEQGAEIKLMLADILLLAGDVWESTLIYSQIEKAFKNAPIGHEAKFKNAKLSFYINEFDWAKAQLDVLKASTSKLIANDALALSLLISDNIDYDSSYVPLSIYARADLLSFQNKHHEAFSLLDSLENEFSHHLIIDNVLFKKAEIQKKLRNYNAVDSLYQRLYEKYAYSILADDALFLRAELQQNVFKDIEKAMTLYQNLLLEFPGSLHTVEARRRFRDLRGDFIN